jgi:hypothetical protein
VVPPQPASAAAATRAAAALNKRNRIFKIPYLDKLRGTSRCVNKLMAIAGRFHEAREARRSKKVAFRNRILTSLGLPKYNKAGHCNGARRSLGLAWEENDPIL